MKIDDRRFSKQKKRRQGMKKIKILFLFLAVLFLAICCKQNVKADVGDQVFTGSYETAIVKADGSLWVCGDNSFGQLGDGSNNTRNKPVKVMDKVVSVSIGGYYTNMAIVRTDNSLWMCGDNSCGQFGNGTTTESYKPIKVMDHVSKVSVGDGFTAIVKTDGSLWTCGENYYGQLGDGTTTDKLLPVKIMDGVASVSAGSSHLTIVKTDGSLWTCGDNTRGQLGDGSGVEKHLPVKIMDGVASVDAGSYNTAIIRTDRSLWICGENADGQSGIETNKDIEFNYLVNPVKIMDNVVAVNVCMNHTAIIKTDGTLWMCGSNSSGQFGDGTLISQVLPKKVMSGVQMVGVGGTHTVVIKKDGSIWSWGGNEYGQLGNGFYEDKIVPNRIMYVPKQDQVIHAESRTIDIKTKSFYLGARATGGGRLSYISSNKNVAEVDVSGNVRVKSYGTTTITINAAANSQYNSASKKITIKVVPVKTKLKAAKSLSKRKLKLRWKKDKTVTGYQIYISPNKQFKKKVIERNVKKKKTKFQIGRLKSKKKYYVKIRAYKKIGQEKLYGYWSKVKKVKIK